MEASVLASDAAALHRRALLMEPVILWQARSRAVRPHGAPKLPDAIPDCYVPPDVSPAFLDTLR